MPRIIDQFGCKSCQKKRKDVDYKLFFGWICNLISYQCRNYLKTFFTRQIHESVRKAKKSKTNTGNTNNNLYLTSLLCPLHQIWDKNPQYQIRNRLFIASIGPWGPRIIIHEKSRHEFLKRVNRSPRTVSGRNANYDLTKKTNSQIF